MTRPYDTLLQRHFDNVLNNDIAAVEAALIEKHFHVDAIDGDFNTAIIMASSRGYYEMAEMLLRFMKKRDLAESINMGNQLGVTPVMAACASGNVRLLHLLLKNGGALSMTDLGNTCMGMACAHGQIGIVRYLLDAGDKFEPVEGSLCPHPLMLAMMNDHQDILIFFYLPNLSRAGRISQYPQEELQQIKRLEEIVPEIDINEICHQFHGLNILCLAAVLHKRDMFELLVQLEADLDFKLPSQRSVRLIAENHGFDVSQSNPNLNESDCSKISAKKRKKNLPLLKKLGKFLFKKHQ